LKRVDDPLLQASYATQQGRLAQARGDIEEARTHFKTALEHLRQKLKDENHPLISVTKSNLALVLEPDEGLPMMKSVLDSVTTLYGSEHPEVAAAWHSLGLMKTYDSDCPGALEAFDSAIELEKRRPYDKARLGRSRAAKSAALDTVCHRPDEALRECLLASTLLSESGAPDDERIRQLKVCKQLMCSLHAAPGELLKMHEQIVHISGSEEDDPTACK
jgi:tetratricopeptide (TPR) repeat protein